MNETHFDIIIDRGSKYTKNEVFCDLCGKTIPATKTAWQVLRFGPAPFVAGKQNSWNGCSKECANFLILREL